MSGTGPGGVPLGGIPLGGTPLGDISPGGTPLGITMGDAAGIGPEIALKCVFQGCGEPLVVYGSAQRLSDVARMLGLDVQIRRIDDVRDARFAAGTLDVVDRGPDVGGVAWGQIDPRAGQAAYDYVCAAIDDAQLGRLRAIVTAPLNKASMHAAGIDYPGHTEILAERTGTSDFAMMLANDELRVLLVTIHIALADVPQAITAASEGRAIMLAHQACLQMGVQAPRVAIAGLNPHAGESGKFGREEIEVIAPAIASARALGIDASGPWPGDTVFMRARQGEFDIVVAQYHDQGLIPVKYLGLDQGVNVTVGLPFVRTSVDHGTAFDIAGQGIADHASLMAAIRLACRMTP